MTKMFVLVFGMILLWTLLDSITFLVAPIAALWFFIPKRRGPRDRWW